MVSASDPSLSPGAPAVGRQTLPPRMPASSYATPGIPSPINPGVYLSDRAKQLAEAQAEAAAAASQDEDNGLTGSTALKSTGAGSTQRSSQLGAKSGARHSSKLKPIDYSYPELGHTAVAQQQVNNNPYGRERRYFIRCKALSNLDPPMGV